MSERNGTTFLEVQKWLDEAVGGPSADVGTHGPFWRGKTRDEFVGMQIYGRRLIVLGNGPASNLVVALRGLDPFDGTTYPQMPAGMDPMPSERIDKIERWITDGCRN
jgi:hypothetical protein